MTKLIKCPWCYTISDQDPNDKWKYCPNCGCKWNSDPKYYKEFHDSFRLVGEFYNVTNN